MVEPLNQDEWRRWIADHAAKLLLFAPQMARSEADAQDLVQELQMQCFCLALRSVLFSALMPWSQFGGARKTSHEVTLQWAEIDGRRQLLVRP